MVLANTIVNVLNVYISVKVLSMCTRMPTANTHILVDPADKSRSSFDPIILS